MNNYPVEFSTFLEQIIFEAAIEQTPLTHLRYLKMYCEMVGCEYDNLLENINILLEALREYSEKKSDVSLKIASYQAKFCFLPEGFINEITTKLVSSGKGSVLLSYNAHRGGSIFNEMPGGALLMGNHCQVYTYSEYVAQAKLTPKRLAAIQRYEKRFGINKDFYFEEHPIYKDYLSKFSFDWELTIPEDASFFDAPDWDLLIKLVVGSFSTSYSFSLDDGWKRHPSKKIKVRLAITVSGQGKKITKYIDDLWSFQIMSLYRSYMSEQIDVILETKDDELDEYRQLKETRIKKFEKIKSRIIAEAKKYL